MTISETLASHVLLNNLQPNFQCHTDSYCHTSERKLVYKIVSDIQMKLIDINNVILPVAFF